MSDVVGGCRRRVCRLETTAVGPAPPAIAEGGWSTSRQAGHFNHRQPQYRWRSADREIGQGVGRGSRARSGGGRGQRCGRGGSSALPRAAQ